MAIDAFCKIVFSSISDSVKLVGDTVFFRADNSLLKYKHVYFIMTDTRHAADFLFNL